MRCCAAVRDECLLSGTDVADSRVSGTRVAEGRRPRASWDNALVRRSVTIVNRLGLHARAAAKFVNAAAAFASDIRVIKGQQEANGKSIMAIMMLAAGQGTRIVLQASGDDENEAVSRLTALVDDRFGESD